MMIIVLVVAVLLMTGVAEIAASRLFLLLTRVNWPHPYTAWWDYLPYASDSPKVRNYLIVTAILPMLVVAGITFLLYRFQKFRNFTLYGRSKFASIYDGWKTGLVYSLKPRPDCLLLGRTRGLLPLYVGLPTTEHVLVSARTGAGKGVSYVMPNCFNYGESLVVLDVKGENFQNTAGYRQSKGNLIYKFSPLADDGRSHCWNPLGGINKDTPDYISKLQRRAYEIFPEISGRERFWQDRARSAFLGLSILVVETPEMVLSPGTVFRMFILGPEHAQKLINESRKKKKPYSQACLDMIKDYVNATDVVFSGTCNHITSTMSLWFNPRVAAVTSKSDFNLADLRRKKMTVYISVMPADISHLGVLLRLFFLQLFESNTEALPEHDKTLKYRCHVLYDEFPTIPMMRSIAKAAGFMRGFGMHSSYVVQSKNQVKEEYKGQGEASLLENIGAEVIFGTNDGIEASERAGFNTVESTTRGGPRFMAWLQTNKQHISHHDHKRPLLLPQEVVRMKENHELVFRAAIPPLWLKKIYWFSDRNFKDLVMRTPPIPKVYYLVDLDDGSIDINALLNKQEKRSEDHKSDPIRLRP